MSTLAELRSSIRNQLVGQVPTDDTRLRNRFIDYKIREIRSLLINQQARRGLGVDQGYYQTLSCLTIDKDRLICSGYDSGVVQPYIQIPVPEDFRGAIAFLGTVDHSMSFEYKPLSAFLMAVPDRFCVQQAMYTVIGDRAYLKFPPAGLELLTMTAVLQDPAKNKCITDFERTPYPLPQHMVHSLEVICIKQLLATLPIAADTENDATDEGAPERTNPQAIA